MTEITSVRPVAAGNAWLLTCGKSAAIYDTGFACTARDAVRLVRDRLGDRSPEWILLSHSHYDHASGTGIFAGAFPEAVICGAAHCARVFSRPGAKATMRTLNGTAAALYGREPDDDSVEDLRVDRVLRDGDRLTLGDASIEVWETPGHTQCSLSFFFLEESLLLGSETMGIPDGPIPEEGDFVVIPSCMVGVERSLQAIDRAIAARPERILIPHIGVVSGTTAERYLRCAREWTLRGKELVLRGADGGRSVEELIAEWKRMFFTEETARIQPEAAFDLNASYIIPAILKEFGRPQPDPVPKA